MHGSHLRDLAVALARVVHSGQSRKGTGEAYFNHVERVARRVPGWRAQTIAFLHDTIEDTAIDGTTLLTTTPPLYPVPSSRSLVSGTISSDTLS